MNSPFNPKYLIVRSIERERVNMNPLIVMLTGVLIVFIGLICIVAIVKLMTIIYAAFAGNKKQPVAEPAKPAESSSVDKAERGKIIAAISAAIGETTGMKNIRIVSIKKV